MILGDGWYCGRVGWGGRQGYGPKPELLAGLDIAFADDSSARFVTDGSWKTATGPILENDLLMGEIYDARKELTGWTGADYDDSAWTPAQTGPPGTSFSTPSTIRSAPNRRTQTQALGNQRYDMGQNFSGRIRIRVKAPRDTSLTFRYAEILNPDGSLYTENLRGARATDTYICKGGGEETWEPGFTFHGFRYVEVDGLPANAEIEITGLVLQSDTAPTGEFFLLESPPETSSSTTLRGAREATSSKHPRTARNATSAWAGPATHRSSFALRPSIWMSGAFSTNGCRTFAMPRRPAEACRRSFLRSSFTAMKTAARLGPMPRSSARGRSTFATETGRSSRITTTRCSGIWISSAPKPAST